MYIRVGSGKRPTARHADGVVVDGEDVRFAVVEAVSLFEIEVN